MSRHRKELQFTRLRELYPNHTEAELQHMDESLRRYLAIVVDVYRQTHGYRRTSDRSALTDDPENVRD